MSSSHDEILAACEKPISYPTELLRSRLFQYAQRAYHELLDERDPHVFRKESSLSRPYKLRIWDWYDGDQGFRTAHICESVVDVRQYLVNTSRKDPRCRHVFLRSPHSLDRLNLSREMFCFIMNFHQVMAQFLDIVLNFGKTPGHIIPTASQRCMFYFEDFLDTEEAKRFSVPQLGRSGLETRHCYNLWAVERSQSQEKRAPWEIRQAGIYHSFDMENGKSTWIHVKANDNLEVRIKEASVAFQRRYANCSQLHASFSTTLLTQIIMFEWCSENWCRYLNYWETELERVLIKIKKAPISKAEKLLTDAKQFLADMGPPSRQGSFSPNMRTTAVSSRVTSWRSLRSPLSPVQTSMKSMWSSLPSPTSPRTATFGNIITEKHGTDQTRGPEQDDDPLRALTVLQEFKFEDLQYLHHIASKLHEADMVINLNSEIISEVKNYLERVVQSSQDIRDKCKGTIADFSQRTTAILRGLDIDRARISTLAALLEDGKALFDATTQFRNIEFSMLSAVRMERMTEDMHESTLKMEEIAGATGKETSSMHTITLVTLVFLPGTFVAVRYALPYIWEAASKSLTTTNCQTFLGAGFYQWPDGTENGDGVAAFPLFRPAYFALFAAIAFPLTFITVVFWFLGPLVWRYASRTKILRLWRRGCQENGCADEEAQLAPLGIIQP
ncbi:hypothetical protein GGR57DRAFT_471933 [Xylariaceae sp. FL1272]|nr:hypothetical protein GGR57DRAFT_471933 [Xylariaceae sp. FL1272]